MTYDQRLNVYLWVVGIIVTLIITGLTVLFGNDLDYYFRGELKIDFKADEIFVENGIPSLKIEVLNNLGYPLSYINGTVTLSCKYPFGSFKTKSQTFKLEGRREFLAHGTGSEFLLSPDPLFVDLVKTRENSCSDVNIQFANYQKINSTHAKLESVDVFKIIDDTEFRITKEIYNYPDQVKAYSCLHCEVLINISSLEKKFSKIEDHTFVDSLTVVYPFESVIEYPEHLTNTFTLSHYGSCALLKPCEGLMWEECRTLICSKINEKYNTTVKCGESRSSPFLITPPFTNKVVIP